MSWVPLDLAPRKIWGVFDSLGYSAEPFVLTFSYEDAERWVRYHTEEAPEDDRMNIELAIARVRLRRWDGEAWNSYDEPDE